MGHQLRLTNRNEDNNPNRGRDARALRYLLASNSFYSVAFNSRIGSTGTNYQVVSDNIIQNNPLHPTHIPPHSNPTNTTISHVTNHNHYPSPTAINISNFNDNQTSPSSESSPPRLFGSSLALVPTTRGNTAQLINTTNFPSSMYPSITQLGTAPTNYHEFQSRAGNDNDGSSTSFINGRNDNIDASNIVTSSGTGNASLKRSRSPDFVRGESSNQGSQASGTLRRRISPPPTTFQQESMNNNNMPLMSSTPLSSRLLQQGNQSGVGATQNSITGEPHIINRYPAHDGPAGFFDYTTSYNSPTQFIIDEDVDRLLVPYQRETHWANFTMFQRTELVYASTSPVSLYPSIITGGITQAAVSTSLFQGNNNFLSYEAGPSSSSRSLGWGFNGFNNNNNNNFDLFDSIQHNIDDTLVHSAINVQQYERILPRGRVSRFLAPSIVPVWSNSFIPQRSQLPFDHSTSSYRLNPPLPPRGPAFSTVVESNQYMQMVTSFSRSGNPRNMLRDEDILDVEEHIENVEPGLTEEEIQRYIETEIHLSNPNETNTQNKTCTICQEDYVEGEIIGRLDCRHIYHLECIKQWLLLKNACPICKQRALNVD